jgi:GNAT superfamily N-acetyltransferase
VIPAPQLETAIPEDIAALAEIRVEQGWLPNWALLRAAIGWEGCRFFVLREPARESGAPGDIVATTCAVVSGPTGSIGSVAVLPQYQRRGLGRQLMEAALEWQRAAGARSVLLDATVEGRTLYRRLGFVPTGARSWFAYNEVEALHRDALSAHAGDLRATLRSPDEIGRVAELDRAALGGDRVTLLARVLAEAEAWLYLVEDEHHAPLGYLLVRAGEGEHPVLRLGSWVASRPAAAAALLAAVLDPAAPWRARLPLRHVPVLAAPVPGYAPDALMLWNLAGGEVEIDDLIMQLDFDPEASGIAPAAGPPRRFAAHPEWTYAWLNPMTL